jgi:HD-like signal output (HDOD) protein
MGSFFKRLFSGFRGSEAARRNPIPPSVRSADVPPEKPWPAPDPDSVRLDQKALAAGFCDLLLDADSRDDPPPPNEVERFIVSELERLLDERVPDEAIPRLPEVAATLMRELADPEVPQQRILRHLTRDPAIASEVLRMANSPLYRGGGDPIENLDSALRLLGLERLKGIVSAVLMKPLLDIRPIYFRLFGQNLWRHSLDCAEACQTLAIRSAQGNPFNAYLVGLLHDIGKLVIFRLLIESFRRVDPNIQPRGAVFSGIVRDKSARLSHHIVSQWSLADYLVTALEEQTPGYSYAVRSDYGRILREANRLAEFNLLAERRVKTRDDFHELAAQFEVSEALFQAVFPKAAEKLLALPGGLARCHESP